ncbi:hypothetical protein CXF68_02720 [Tenacibaculum sp. Bg11-29]|uniref:hypothetical protein n=1 Tax=Tenacibaculum sp. Bg11-29 TaxID=2058306 RepID=UPI000C31D11E|nr:hypothetical protein [Tenacibaculum sp. Bg11-29]PKH49671.1 hypothetical protein CXF68_02720 [Tenacibaculum sp. Bg11-29]
MYEELEKFKEDEDKEFYPIKDYKIQFYGNGKTVGLLHPTAFSHPNLENWMRGKSASKYKVDGEWYGANFAPIYLSITKDKHKKGEFNFEYAR